MGGIWIGLGGMIVTVIRAIVQYFNFCHIAPELFYKKIPFYAVVFLLFFLWFLFYILLRNEKGREFLKKIPIKAIQRRANDIPRTIANRDEHSEDPQVKD